ncbi:D-alanine--D-alanine ligase [Micromonospora sp. WMMD1120]|uniref:D-alanine--D-alanine ligase family protein n=1 Tax=Micromonospora sp. WMMD1120 TaxID=3016106 RepID=UPI0024177F76|nr:D-alanine--D-alanine ligase family protein [Micromonospora sp. WMMD1120]MDG4810556.1 D-alanine--D-alanine ligase [Micromonospora sp. WMMD1120]
MTTRLAVLYGGQSGEHDVSCRSAASILAHLDPARHQVTEVLIDRDGGWHVGGRPTPLPQALRVLRDQDVVFPALHGPYGEDGIVSSLLEWLGVPYVGNGVFASAAGMDKAVTKRLLAAAGLRVSPGVTLRPDEDLSAAERDRLDLPVFVKPARAGSSLGVVRVDDWAGVPAAVGQARRFDPKVLVEQGARGREIDVAVLQHPDGRVEAGPPLEIRVTGAGFFDYDAKYDGGAVFQIPAPLDAATTGVLQDRAIQAFRALDCRGLLRVDFFLPTEGSTEPIVNEVNTFPGFTAASQFPQIWERAGIGFATLIDILISGALADEGRGRHGGPSRQARAVDLV